MEKYVLIVIQCQVILNFSNFQLSIFKSTLKKRWIDEDKKQNSQLKSNFRKFL